MKNEILHEKREFSNMRDLIEWAADFYREKYAYSFREDPHQKEATRISFIQFRDDVRALASSLIDMGCTGKHCIVCGKYSYEWAMTYYAVFIAGGVLVPLDKDWQADELADTAEKAEADYIFCDRELADKAAVIAGRIQLSASPVLFGAEDAEDGKTIGFNGILEAGRKSFAQAPEKYFNAEIDPYKLSLLVFTSGTTGKGKGVMLSQHNFLSDMSDVVQYIDFSDKTLGLLPLHHTYGSSVMLTGHIMIGCETYISAGLRHLMKELNEEKPGHLILVPLYLESFYRKIMSTAKESGKDKLLFRMIKISNALRKIGIDLRKTLFKSVTSAFGGNIKMVITGGAPINQGLLNFFDSIGISSLNGYGITECAPIIAVNRSRRVTPQSVGPILNINDVKIDSPNEYGEGEILIKGSNVMLGYYKDEKATAEAFDSDGYFKSGDFGLLDENKVLYITGRKKNLIILSNGKNVYPEEIENELSATPGVLDVVVYEGQSRRGLEHNAIVAEIYPDKEYIEKNGITDVYAYLKPYISEYNKGAVQYKKVTVLKVREEEFPKNTLRKIMRFKIDMTID